MGKKKTKKVTDLDMQAQIDPAPESAMQAVMDELAATPKDPFPTDTVVYAVEESEFAYMKRRREKERV